MKTVSGDMLLMVGQMVVQIISVFDGFKIRLMGFW